MLKRLDFDLFDQVLEQAEASPRHRMHYDLRDSAEEASQRMLNVLYPDTVIPIHRHNETSEIVAVLRGKVKEILYDDKGVETDSCVMECGSDCPAVVVPQGVYHTAICLEPGSVILEIKARKYDPVLTEDFLKSTK